MSSDTDPSGEIADTAARWVARHDRGLTPEEAVEFQRWLEADDRHRAEWRSLEGSWQALGGLPGCSRLVEEASRLERETRRSRWPRSVKMVALAAAAAVTLGLAAFMAEMISRRATTESPTIVRVAPDVRRHTLTDGSLAEARRDAIVVVDFSPSLRRVRLERGEAYFTVAHDTARAFVVEVGGVAVRAVGTAFFVRRDVSGIDVLVTEGRVRVGAPLPSSLETAPILEAGSAARVDTDTGSPTIEKRAVNPSEIEQSLGWRSPSLEFSRAPLEEVLEAFREYAPHRVKLGDLALRRRTLTGRFQADNIEGFLRLASTFDLRVERTESGDTLLLPAHP